MEKAKAIKNALLRKNRVRSKVSGTSDRPRLTVNISNRHIVAQIIDDQKGLTLVSSSTVGKKDLNPNMTQKAVWIGDDIAKKALKSKITKVTLDRKGKKYHGRLAELADAARKQGLEF